MGTEQKQVQENLSQLEGKVKDIDANQQKLLKASKTDGEASKTDDEASKTDGEASKKADEDLKTEDETSAVRNATLWVTQLKDKVIYYMSWMLIVLNVLD